MSIAMNTSWKNNP